METLKAVERKRLAITVGVFDCLHEGHIELFKRMKECGESVLVILHDDVSTFENKKRFPVQELSQRGRNLKVSGLVDDGVYVHTADPSEQIMREVTEATKRGILIEEMVYVRGDDWRDFPGRKTVEAIGLEIVFKEYTRGVSTTEIRKDLGVTNQEDMAYIEVYCSECGSKGEVPRGSAIGRGSVKFLCSDLCESLYNNNDK